jgi:hypothetical protein
MKEVEFTDEELLYIEKIMDINASICGDKISKFIEIFMLAKSMEDENKSKLLSDVIMELAEANLITKQIRNKIEESRK